jgi:hypothetical protein
VKNIEGEKKEKKVEVGSRLEGVVMTTIDIPSTHTFEVITKMRLYGETRNGSIMLSLWSLHHIFDTVSKFSGVLIP